MKKNKGLLVIVIVFNFFVLCTSCLQVKWGKGLYGAVILTDRPEISLENIMDGEYQQQLSEWYSENISIQELCVRSYNELLFSMGVASNSIIVGKNNYLFSTDYVEAYYKYVQLPNVEVTYPEYAEKISAIQEILEEEGKIFIYFISPSKAEIYPQYIPEQYSFLEYTDRITNHEREVEEFRINGVNLYDAQVDMLTVKENIPSFYKQGIHWNFASCSYCMNSMFDKYLNDYSMEIVIEETGMPSGAGEDLYLLANIWRKPYEDDYYTVNISWDVMEKPNVYVLGTSFSDHIVEILRGTFSEEAFFDELVHYSYLNRGSRINEHGVENIPLSLNLEETSILEDIKNSDIIIIENNASYIPESFFIVADYLYENLH